MTTVMNNWKSLTQLRNALQRALPAALFSVATSTEETFHVSEGLFLMQAQAGYVFVGYRGAMKADWKDGVNVFARKHITLRLVASELRNEGWEVRPSCELGDGYKAHDYSHLWVRKSR